MVLGKEACKKQPGFHVFLVSAVKDSRTLVLVTQQQRTVKATNTVPGALCCHSVEDRKTTELDRHERSVPKLRASL